MVPYVGLLWTTLAFLLPFCQAQQDALQLQKPLPKCDASQIEVREECPSARGFDWETYGELLYQARGRVFLGDLEGAKRSALELLQAATTPFSSAFECQPAAAATYFSLAQILAFQGFYRRALGMVQMGFIFIRDKGFSECTPWPLQGWDMMLAGRNLVQRVRELDKPAVQQVPWSLRTPGLKVAVVTICAYAEDEAVRVLATQNHQLYAQVHGYDLHLFTSTDQIKPHVEANMDVTDGVHKPFFWKVNAVRNVMDMPQGYDWVLWADCDAFFMEPERTIDSIVSMYADNTTVPTVSRPHLASSSTRSEEDLERELYPAEPPPVSLILAVDSTGINNGVWLLRNNAWAKDFLYQWWHSDILSGPGKDHNCSDQSTMQHQLLHNNVMRVDDAWDAAEGPIWPREVRVAAQEDMQSFHQATAMTVASREWQEGDFIKHHPGCHYYKEPCKQLYWQAAVSFEDKVRALMQRQALG